MYSRTFLVIFCAFFATSLYAQFNQWEPANGIPIRTGSYIGFERSIDSNENGLTLISWSENISEERNLFASLLDEEGNLLWNEAVVICDAPQRQELPVVKSLPDNEWIIAWYDYRENGDSYNLSRIYFQKIDSEGNLLFAENGILLRDDFQHNTYPLKIINDASNGFIISWTSDNGNNNDLHSQHLDNDGNFLWDNDGLLVAGGGGDQGISENGYYGMISDNNGGAIFALVDERLPDQYGITIQRVNEAGERLWYNTNNTRIVISTIADSIRSVALEKDGQGGAYVAWCTLTNAGSNVYAQHIDSEGDIYWETGGVVISDVVSAAYWYPKLCPANDGSVILEYWASVQGSPATNFLQKLSGTETVIQHWNDGEDVGLLTGSYEVYDIQFVPDDSGGAFFTWDIIANNEYFRGKIITQHVNSDGEPTWTAIGNPGIQINGNTSGALPVVRSLYNGNAVIAWQSYREEGFGIHAQIVSEDGELIFNDDGFEIQYGIDGSAYPIDILESDSCTFVVWMDSRSHAGYSFDKPYIQKLDAGGNSLFAENGICLNPALYSQNYNQNGGDISDLKIIGDQFGGVIAVWNQPGNYTLNEVIFQQISSIGTLQQGSYGYVLPNFHHNDQYLEEILNIDNGDFLIFYTEDNFNISLELKCMKYNSQFETQWDSPLSIPTNEDPVVIHVKSTILVEDDVFLTYYTQVPTGSELYVNSINLDGTMNWDDPVILPSENGIILDSPIEITGLDNNILVTWSCGVPDVAVMLKAKYLDIDGNDIWEPEGRILAENESHFRRMLIGTSSSENNSFWLFSEQLNDHGYVVNTINRLDTEAESLFENALLIPGAGGNTFLENMLVLPDNSNFLVWRTRANSDLIFTHLDLNGEVVESGTPYPNGRSILSSASRAQFNSKTVQSGESSFTAIWSDQRVSWSEGATDLYAQKIDDGYTGIKEGNQQQAHLSFKINKTWPNPFNPSINISYQLAEKSAVKISVFDILGREVAVLINTEMNAGIHQTFWDGKNGNGLISASGTYFLRMETPEVKQVKKITLVK